MRLPKKMSRQDTKTPKVLVLNCDLRACSVMPGLGLGIHEFVASEPKTWMTGTSPAMTIKGERVGALAPWWFNLSPSALSECLRKS
jgi:hypothetical protein